MEGLIPTTFDYSGYTITTDKAFMHVQDVYKWLSEKAYWYKDLTFETFKNGFDHSFCFGALIDGRQVGYGRLITDYATFGYLADVYVEEEHRGKGLSKIMMHTLMELDWMKGLRRINLRTKDAFDLYKKFGFTAPKYPERVMGRGRTIAGNEFPSQKYGYRTHTFELHEGTYTITTDKGLMNMGEIHRWLYENSYWAKNIPFDTFKTAFNNSFCIGILDGEMQIGFARLISDFEGIGYLADVYIAETHRGMGLSKIMLERLFDYNLVKGLNINLVTRDSHGLYEKFGFEVCNPERIMELVRPDIYLKD